MLIASRIVLRGKVDTPYSADCITTSVPCQWHWHLPASPQLTQFPAPSTEEYKPDMFLTFGPFFQGSDTGGRGHQPRPSLHL